MASFVLRGLIYPTVAARSRSSGNWICVRQMSSSHAPALAPWLMIGDSSVKFEDGGADLFYNFYNVGDEQVRKEHKKRGKHGVLVGSSHGWLALYKWGRGLYKWRRVRRCGFDMFLYNPRSHSYVNLPSVETLAVNHDPSFNTCPRVTRDDPMAIYSSHLPKKVILSSSPNDNDEEDCWAIMSFGSYDHHYLAYCRPGRSIIWTLFGHPRLSYEDFVYSTGLKQLFCTTKCHKFESWDFGDPLAPRLNWRVGDDDDIDYDSDKSKPEYAVKKGFCSLKYLVFAEQSKRLFLVRRNVIEKIGGDSRRVDRSPIQLPPYQTIGFDVHELIVDDDSKRGKLIYMDGKLDGMAFFIGSTGHGFVIEETDEVMIMNVKPDSIYYTDPKELTPPPWDREASHGGHDLGIFDYESRTFSSCCHPCDPRSIRRIEPTPTWFMPSPPY